MLNFSNLHDKRLAAPLLDKPFTRGQIGVLLPPRNDALLDFVNGYIRQAREKGRLNELQRIYLEGQQDEKRKK